MIKNPEELSPGEAIRCRMDVFRWNPPRLFDSWTTGMVHISMPGSHHLTFGHDLQQMDLKDIYIYLSSKELYLDEGLDGLYQWKEYIFLVAGQTVCINKENLRYFEIVT